MPRNATNLLKFYRKFGIQWCDCFLKIWYWLKILALFYFEWLLLLIGRSTNLTFAMKTKTSHARLREYWWNLRQFEKNKKNAKYFEENEKCKRVWIHKEHCLNNYRTNIFGISEKFCNIQSRFGDSRNSSNWNVGSANDVHLDFSQINLQPKIHSQEEDVTDIGKVISFLKSGSKLRLDRHI